MHTTASDGRLTPVELVDARRGGGTDDDQRHRSRHHRGARRGDGGGAARRAFASFPGIEITAIDDGTRRARARLPVRSGEPAAVGAAREPARAARDARQGDRRHGSRRSTCPWTSNSVLISAAAPPRIVGRPSAARARAGARRPRGVGAGSVRQVARDRPPGLRAAHRAESRLR